MASVRSATPRAWLFHRAGTLLLLIVTIIELLCYKFEVRSKWTIRCQARSGKKIQIKSGAHGLLIKCITFFFLAAVEGALNVRKKLIGAEN